MRPDPAGEVEPLNYSSGGIIDDFNHAIGPVLPFSYHCDAIFCETIFTQNGRTNTNRLADLGEPIIITLIFLVPKKGVEPLRCCHRRILSPLRLPVPPLRHSIFSCNNYFNRKGRVRQCCHLDRRCQFPAGFLF
jgi:hypothetical protein